MASKRERQEKKLQASRERKELAHAKQLQEEALREQEKIRNQQRLEELRQIQEKERLTAIRQQFPTFVYKGEADSQFVERVKKITESFDFDSLPDVLRDWYAQIKADPYFLKEFASYDGGANPRVLHYMFHMGEYIYSSLGDEIKRWVPFNDLRVIPTGKSIVIKFGSLKKVRGEGGTLYHSPLEPKIKFGSKEYIVSYSTHAIEQTLARLVGRGYSYAGAGDAFGFFNNCMHYEVVTLLNGVTAFTFYDKCSEGFLNWHYANAIYGNKMKDDKFYYRRIGYCPIVFDGQYAVAKTLLYPGYQATPEAKALDKLHKQLRDDYIKIINTPISDLLKNGVARIPPNYFAPTKYLHPFIKQVIETDEDYYAVT
jgi:hypothetical protein